MMFVAVAAFIADMPFALVPFTSPATVIVVAPVPFWDV
ncbi:hypothetical protein OHAE_4421 [Ochrobactrum soli]|uniref:Uncharacterized protein n=1 Tax=Ochrobactrum soli TaxID=2448455 RepID=A0A2P9HC04_9HYPH|nr:hypothetical protein OHAE_4421 [[Ochrobactrum] soli]